MNINKHILKYLNYQYPLKDGYILTDDVFGIINIKEDLNQVFGFDVQFDIFNDWLYKIFPNKIIKIKYFIGFWEERTFDRNGNVLTIKNCYGNWWESTYNKNGDELTYKDSIGYWAERTFDNNGNQLTNRGKNF